MKLPPGRALIASSIEAVYQRWRDDPQEGVRKHESIKQRAIKRAHITEATHHIRGNSGDTVSRSPIMAPWPIYPLTAEDCAALTCDLVIFETVLSPDALVEEAKAAGLSAEVLLPLENGEVSGSQEVLRIGLSNTTLTLHADGLNLLLYELVQPKAWIAGLREVLAMDKPPSEPVMVFAGEEGIWHV